MTENREAGNQPEQKNHLTSNSYRTISTIRLPLSACYMRAIYYAEVDAPWNKTKGGVASSFRKGYGLINHEYETKPTREQRWTAAFFIEPSIFPQKVFAIFYQIK